MGSLSIRGVDEELAALLKEAAAVEQKSVNSIVLSVLKKHLGVAKEKRFTQDWHDLDSLFGRWSEDEYARVQGRIDEERQIDEELWK
jgi:plasmid stability protein